MGEYSADEVSTICGEIHRRIKGGMEDDSFDSFKKMITPIVIGCNQCEGTGCFFDGKGLTVCRRCDYHRSRGRALSLKEPASITKGRMGK